VDPRRDPWVRRKTFANTAGYFRKGGGYGCHNGGGGLAIDYERRRVTVDGNEVTLTATEYEVLRILSVEAPRVVATGSLLRRAWGAHLDPNVRSEAHRVRAFVRKLRRKLGDDAGSPRLILNERGVGYRMAKPEEA